MSLPSSPEYIKFPKEILECPVCRTIPEDNFKLFQCKNGHIICESCNAGLRIPECPCCRTSLHEEIRNRKLEDIRQYVTTQCPYVAKGCTKVLQRRELPMHLIQCRFRPMHLCKAIGFHDCDYDAYNSSDPRKIMDHLTTTHLIEVTLGSDISYEFDTNSLTNLEENGRDKIMKLFGPRRCRETSTFFLFLMKFDKESNELSAQCICIGHSEKEAEKHRAAFYFTSINEQKCVAVWPTICFRDFMSDNEIASAASNVTDPEGEIWDSAFHLSKRTLKTIQGQESSLRVLVRVKEKDEF